MLQPGSTDTVTKTEKLVTATLEAARITNKHVTQLLGSYTDQHAQMVIDMTDALQPHLCNEGFTNFDRAEDGMSKVYNPMVRWQSSGTGCWHVTKGLSTSWFSLKQGSP